MMVNMQCIMIVIAETRMVLNKQNIMNVTGRINQLWTDLISVWHRKGVH